MKRCLLGLCLIAILLPAMSCSRDMPGPAGEGRPLPEARTFSDDLGRKISLPSRPERIVSLAPGMTEMLFALGLEERIVGVTDVCDYPLQVRSLKRVGAYTNPSLEMICSLDPDLILAMHGISKSLLGRLENLGLTVVALNPTDMEGFYRTIADLGRLTGSRKRAETLISGLRRRQAAVTTGATDAKRPRVFYVIWDEPLFTAGSGTFIDDVIRLAGGYNVASDVGGYVQFSREQLVAYDPDIIIYSDKTDLPGKIGREAGWKRLKAVRRGRVYAIDEDIISRPGPRLLDGLEKVADLLRSGSPEGGK